MPAPEASHIDVLRTILSNATIIDLTHTMEVGMPAWPTQARYGSILHDSYDKGDESVHSMIVLSEHTGTHIDAPMHFQRGGATVDELALDAVIGRLVAIDASHLGPNDLLPLDFIRSFESQHGALEPGDIVIFRFGWDDKWAPGRDAAGFLKDWPGLSEEGARYLIEKGVKAVGTDAASLDAADADPNICHVLLLGAGIPLLENVDNVKKLPPVSFVIGLANKFKGGSGSPIRLLAIVEDR